ncbi:MAG: GEVED domain-containing protein [Pirellulaceae bacterium]
MGSSVDVEEDGNPAANDGVSGDSGDDGVEFASSIVAASNFDNLAAVRVSSSQAGMLDAWIDFNRDGDWLDTGEQIFASQQLQPGSNRLAFSVPAGASAGETYARFRVSSGGGLSPTGAAIDGEVEDHRAMILDGDAVDGVIAGFQLDAADTITVDSDSADVVIKDQERDLFRAPMSSLSELRLTGSTEDDRIMLALPDLLHSGLLQVDAGNGEDQLVLDGGDRVLDLTNIDDNAIRGIEIIDVRGSGSNQLTFRSADLASLQASAESLVVLADPDDHLDSGAERFAFDGSQVVDGQLQITAKHNGVELHVRGAGWTNPFNRLDVNGSGFVSPLDALLILNALGSGQYIVDDQVTLRPPESVEPFPLKFYDVLGDGNILPLGALRILNHLQREAIDAEAPAAAPVGLSSARPGR